MGQCVNVAHFITAQVQVHFIVSSALFFSVSRMYLLSKQELISMNILELGLRK